MITFSLSLIIPVHNGESFIEHSVREYYDFFSENFKKFELIVVCNSCTDNTEKICNLLSKKIPIKVVNAPKRGKGNAILKGFNSAQYEIVGFLDADNPYDLNQVLKMLDYIGSYDMVIVTKFRKALKYQSSISRRFFSLSGAIVFRILFGLKFNDTQAGAKFMKKKLLDKLEKPFVCNGFEFDMELLYKVSKKNAKIKEYYIAPKETNFSTVKMRILPGILYRLIKLRILR